MVVFYRFQVALGRFRSRGPLRRHLALYMGAFVPYGLEMRI